MNAPEPDKPAVPPARSGLPLVGWSFFFILVFYPLSVGPVAKFATTSATRDVVRVIYAPLIYLYEHNSAVESFFNWYLRLWGVL